MPACTFFNYSEVTDFDGSILGPGTTDFSSVCNRRLPTASLGL